MFFSTLALYSVLNRDEENNRWLWLAACFCGLAMGVKYTGFFTAVGIMLIYAWQDRAKPLTVLRNLALFTLAAAFFVVPWLVKNYLYQGNPVFPFALKIFGAGPQADQQKLSDFIGHASQMGPLKPLAWLLTPWKITMGQIGNSEYFSPLFLLLLPGAFLLSAPAGAALTGLWIFFLTVWLGWSVSSTMVRFLMPAYPAAGLVMAAYLFSPGHKALKTALKAVTLAVCFTGLYWAGLSATLGRLDAGRSSFVMGRHTLHGVWWYFPAAVALKTPLLVLLAAAAGAWVTIRKFRKDYLWLLLPPAVFFAAALTAKVQIGYRHVMPVMPFLAALAGLALARLAAMGARRAWLAGIFAVLIPVSALTAHPHYLAYFNQLSGGPSEGYKYFVDSNLDWGQGVKELPAHLKEKGNLPVIFAYFGTARPEAYGVKYAPLGLLSNVEMRGTGERVCGMRDLLLAVSATNLQGTYYPDKASFAWLKERKPVFAAGHSIFLYDLAGDPEGMRSLAALFDREGRNEEAECLYGRAGGEKP